MKALQIAMIVTKSWNILAFPVVLLAARLVQPEEVYMIQSRRFSLILTSVWLGVASVCTAQERETKSESKRTLEFRPIRLIDNAFPAIKNPRITSDAEKSDLEDNELVLGVVINGKARAYPINMLTGPQREIINDHLGGRAIAATW